MEERKHEFELEIPASPEAVWHALSTAEGLVSWFTAEARVEAGAGGTIWLKWADGMEGKHEILEWDPGRRLVLGWRGQSMTFDMEGRDGSARLRLVHSGFSMDSKFDEEYDATYGGWSTYLAVLKYVLTAKAGEPVVNVTNFRIVEARREALLPLVMDAGKICDMAVEELARPATGYVVAKVRDLSDSLVAVFCEGFGDKTYVTVAAYLLKDSQSRAEFVRSRIASVLDNLKPNESQGAEAASLG